MLLCALCVSKRVREFSSQLIVFISLLLLLLLLLNSFHCSLYFIVFLFFFLCNRMLSTFPLKIEMVLSVMYLEVDKKIGYYNYKVHHCSECVCMCLCVVVRANVHKKRSNNQITSNPIYFRFCFYWLRFNSHTHTHSQRVVNWLCYLLVLLASCFNEIKFIINHKREEEKNTETVNVCGVQVLDVHKSFSFFLQQKHSIL